MSYKELEKAINSAIGSNIRYLRVKKGWSQEELSFNADVSVRQLINIENGKAGCYPLTLVKLSDVLGIKPTFIVSQLDDIYYELKEEKKE